MLYRLSNLNSNLAVTLGYLNPALENSVMVDTLLKITVTGQWNQPRDNGVVSEFSYKSGTSWEKMPWFSFNLPKYPILSITVYKTGIVIRLWETAHLPLP